MIRFAMGYSDRLAALGVCLVALGCGAADGDRVQVISEPVVGGYLDDTDKAVLGLAINGQSLGFDFFSGHCSGTLIAQNLILTARHCVSLISGGGSQGEVICGQTGFGFQGPGTVFRATTLAVRPGADGPDFYRGTGQVRPVPGANDICGYDIALILLEGAGIPESVAKPIVPRIDSTPEAAEEFSAVGYGLTDPNGGGGGERFRSDGNRVTCIGEQCAGALGPQVRSTEWQGTAQVCPGDSGGPALDTQGRVMGVASRGPPGCLFSVYGDVGSWGNHIIETAIEAAKLGGYEPPFWATTRSSTPPPPPPPLGEPCSGPCRDGYFCVTADGTKNVCAPGCNAANPSCPGGYECHADVGVCVPVLPPANPALRAASDEEGGCSTSPPRGPAKPVPWLAGGLLALALWHRSRRARSQGGGR